MVPELWNEADSLDVLVAFLLLQGGVSPLLVPGLWNEADSFDVLLAFLPQ
ncbi:hypothetical protein K503DRAFT_804128 [Rhizopogon vinicolor AM-OR11-026]|uniref:Uncharacterized protein n=1 Tax=Rhizopogon vinicolor AM-OR11-026 TaxID=1314800 RepID=A0A1B7MMB7_9AGAM|nr:hypothetical protein K503DRAFT_804128 [Rhizopogon vinicolor AM-OR11-026]